MSNKYLIIQGARQNNLKNINLSTGGTATEVYDYLRLLFAKVGRVVCPVCASDVRSYNPSEVLSELLDNYAGQRAYILTPVIIPDKAVANAQTKKTGKAKKNSVSKRDELNTLLVNLAQRGFFRLKSENDIFTISGESIMSGAQTKADKNPHPHLNPLPEGEEITLPFKGRDRVAMGFSNELPPDIEEHYSKGDIYIVIDRISINQESRKRISDSVELAFSEGMGSILIDVPVCEVLKFDTKFKC